MYVHVYIPLSVRRSRTHRVYTYGVLRQGGRRPKYTQKTRVQERMKALESVHPRRRDVSGRRTKRSDEYARRVKDTFRRPARLCCILGQLLRERERRGRRRRALEADEKKRTDVQHVHGFCLLQGSNGEVACVTDFLVPPGTSSLPPDYLIRNAEVFQFLEDFFFSSMLIGRQRDLRNSIRCSETV